MKFLDANIFIRFMTGDDPAKARACLELFRALENGDEATTSEVILAEVIYVLTSPRLYALSHVETSARIRRIISLSGLKLENKRRFLRALDLFDEYPRLDFEDCLIAALIEQAEDIDGVISNDRGFDRIPWLTRTEPATTGS